MNKSIGRDNGVVVRRSALFRKMLLPVGNIYACAAGNYHHETQRVRLARLGHAPGDDENRAGERTQNPKLIN